MRVRITAVNGDARRVPRDEPRFTWLPPSEGKEYEVARVYFELNSLDDLRWLQEEYGDLRIQQRGLDAIGYDGTVYPNTQDDKDLLEIEIMHDCQQNS